MNRDLFRPRFEGNPVFLLRTHRTSGQSLKLSLARAFRSDEVAPWSYTYQFVGRAPQEFADYRFFQGHIGIPTARRSVPDCRFVVTLRDPVARLISSYFYWRVQVTGRPGYPHHEVALRLQTMTLLEFVRSSEPVIQRAAWNVQARLLAGADYGEVRPQRSQLFGLENSEDLASKALEGLAGVDAVVITERFDETLANAWQTLHLPGRPRTIVDNRLSVRFKDQPVTDEILEHARGLTAVDQIVYDAARTRFGLLDRDSQA